MRESLTIFAIALIVVLSALLVGPYLVDWSSQRDWLAAKLSETIGAKVTIAGPVDVKILPRPLFRAGNVSIAGASKQGPAVTAAGLDAELSINSLLQGSVEFVDATVVQPRLEITVRDDGSVAAAAADVANPGRFAFRRVRIRDGSVVVRDPAGAVRARLDGLDAEGEAETLYGPARFAGQATASRGPFRFRLSTGAYASRRLRVKLLADDLRPLAHADLDGVLTLGTTAGGAAPLGFAGSLAVDGSLHVADRASPVPWQAVAADLKADGKGVSSTQVELRAGADARALVADGAALLDFGAAPSAVVKLRARQLDLDRIAVPPAVAPDTPRPKAAQWLAALQDVIGSDSPLPLRLSLDYGVDAVTSGDLTLTDAAGTLSVARGEPVRGSFAVAGPDGFRLALDGTLETGAAAVFKGHVDAATRDLPASADRLAPLAPDAADWLTRNAPVHAIALAGAVDLSKTGVAARDLTVTADGSTVTGALALTRGLGNDPPRLFADLRADALDTEHLPALDDVTGLAASLDLSVGVAAQSVKLTHGLLGTLDTGPLTLHLSKTGAAVTLDTFSVSGLDGASVTATASLDKDRHVTARGDVKAADAGPLAALVRQVAPDRLTDTFVDRAARISPLTLGFGLDGSLGDDGRFTPSLVTARGSAAATRFSVSVTPEPARLLAGPTLNILAVLDAPDAAGLLRQAGRASVAPGLLGPGHVELTARGTPDSGYDAHLAAALGDATLAFDGRSDGATGAGRFTGTGRNAGPLLRALALANPPTGAQWPWDVAADLDWTAEALRADKLTGRFAGVAVAGSLGTAAGATGVSGSLTVDTLPFASLAGLVLGPVPAGPVEAGHWLPNARFAAPPDALPAAQVHMRARTLPLTGGLALGNAAFDLRLAPGTLALNALAGDLIGGKASGSLTLRRDGTTASLAGQVDLTGLAVALPSLAGQLTGHFTLAGSGSSPDGLLANLAGDGNLSMTGTIPRFDPQALAATAKLYDPEGATIDGDAIRDALGKALDRGPLDFGTVAGPATVAAGTLRAVGLQGHSAAGAVGSEATLDLRTLQLGLRTTLTAAELPRDWKGDPPQVTLVARGPLAAPVREIDAAAFANGLAARAIARDQERIQLMQDDLRERAFFARRLRQIEEEQRETAAAKARAATAPPTPPGRPAAVDPLAKLLSNLPPLPAAPVPPARPPDRAGTKPVDLQPPPAAATQTTSPNAADPSSAGRY